MDSSELYIEDRMILEAVIDDTEEVSHEGATTLKTVHVDKVLQVLFDVDGCAVAFTLGLLTDQISSGNLYVISYCWEDAETLDFAETNEYMSPRSEYAQRASHVYRVLFSLLNQSPPRVGSNNFHKDRTRTAFVCDLEVGGDRAKYLESVLANGDPLSVECVRQTLNETLTFRLHDELNCVLFAALSKPAGSNSKRSKGRFVDRVPSNRYDLSCFQGGKKGLVTVYVLNEQRTIAAYRRLYGSSATTAFWYISKFGPDEKSLVLCTRYYLLQSVRSSCTKNYDLQAVKDICLTYDVETGPNDSGLRIQDLTSFAKLSKFCCRSRYAVGPVADGFPRYVVSRVSADTKEVFAVKDYINRDRGGLRISDEEFVKYVYLAYFECYNRRQLGRHLNAVSVKSADENVRGRSDLGKRAIEEFFTHVRSQLNIKDYVAENIRVESTALLPGLSEKYAAARLYRPICLDVNVDTRTGFYGSATQTARKLDSVESALALQGWPVGAPSESRADADERRDSPSASLDASDWSRNPLLGNPGSTGQTGHKGPLIVKRLLAISSLDESAGNRSVLSYFLGTDAPRGPTPVYRTAGRRGGQSFTISCTGAWAHLKWEADAAARAAENVLSDKYFKNAEDHERDSMLTKAVVSANAFNFGSPSACASVELNRNEIFNANLCVGNIVLDVDMNLRSAVPALDLHSGMRGFRQAVITAMRFVCPLADATPRSYPCYFFKSACRGARERTFDAPTCANWDDPCTFPPELRSPVSDEIDFQWDYSPEISGELKLGRETGRELEKPRQDAYDTCECTAKVGFRVCVPIPDPYALHGCSALRNVARLIQQAVLLERRFVESVGPYLKDYNIIDTGVYAHGKSLRLPFFCKVDSAGTGSGKLLPYVVLPDEGDSPSDFVRAHFDPANFHFHALSRRKKTPSVIIRSVGKDYVNFLDAKTAINKSIYFKPKTSLSAELLMRGVDVNDVGAIETFATDAILPEVGTYMTAHFPDTAAEYRHLSATCLVAKPNWLLLQLFQGRLCMRGRGFTCVRYKHKRPTGDTVRAYISITVDAHGRLCASVCQQCFATKCGNNKLRTIFTIGIATR